MAELSQEEKDAVKERMQRIQTGIKEKVDASIVSILARYGITSENATAIAAEIYSEYQAASKEVHKEVMGI